MESNSELVSIWKRHVVKLGGGLGSPKDLQVVLQTRAAQASYVKSGTEYEWLEQSSSSMPAMPKVVLDRHQAGAKLCFFDVMPDINRAWASIDSTLYIWELGSKAPVPTVYNKESQNICCVGLAAVQKNVFMAAVKYILVLCTTVEIILLGVCFKDGTPASQLLLVSLPGYTVPADNVTMCSVGCTPSGRIFLGGSNGHIYEVRYGVQGHCRKVCVTLTMLGMLGSYVVPGYVSAAFTPKPAAINAIVVDTSRLLLYTLSSNSAIGAYHLGSDGKMAPQEFARVGSLHAAAQTAPGGASVFRASNKARADPIHLAVVPTHASTKLHLVAVTTDARRVFFTASKATHSLRAAVVVSNDGLISTRGPTTGRTRGVDPSAKLVACYGANTLLVAEKVALEGALSQLLAVLPGLVGGSSHAGAGTGMLAAMQPQATEIVGETSALIPGEVHVVCEVKQKSPFQALLKKGLADDALLQLWLPPPRFVVMSTTGTLQIVRNRPLDVLMNLLSRNPSKAAIGKFFEDADPVEAACMCFCIASRASLGAPGHPGALAEDCLSDSTFVGAPTWPVDPLLDYYGSAPGATGAMGTVTGASDPDWSAMHRGLALFIYRLLFQIWDEPLLQMRTPNGSTTAAVVELSFPVGTLEALERQLRDLAAVVPRVLGRYMSQRQQAGIVAGGSVVPALGGDERGPTKRVRRENALTVEHEKVSALGRLSKTCAEVLLLARKLNEHHVARLLGFGRTEVASALKQMRMGEMLSTAGRERTTKILMLLLKNHMSRGKLPVSLSTELLNGAPTFFPYHQQVYLEALQKLEDTVKKNSAQTERVAAANDFLMRMKPEVAGVVDLNDVADLLQSVKMFEGLVKLSVLKADFQEQSGQHLEAGPAGAAAAAVREAVYGPVASLALKLANSRSAAGNADLSQLLSAATASSSDPVLAHLLFQELMAAGHGPLLIELAPTSIALERHLLALGEARPYSVPWAMLEWPAGMAVGEQQLACMRLLARLYERRQDFLKAAEVLLALGTARVADGVPLAALPNRVQCLQTALVHADVLRDEAYQQRLRAEWRLVLLQEQVLQAVHGRIDALTGQPDPSHRLDELANARSKLQQSSMDPTKLFNVFAVPLKLWDVCLKIMQHTQYNNMDEIKQIWDLLLVDRVQAGAAQNALQGLRNACSAVQDLAADLSHSAWFPVHHILQRLVTVAMGTWPEGTVHAEVVDAPELISQCITAALQTDVLPAIVVMQQLLCQPMGGTGDARVRNSAISWGLARLLCQWQSHKLASQAPSRGASFAAAPSESHAQSGQVMLECLRSLQLHASAYPSFADHAHAFNAMMEDVKKMMGTVF